MTFRTRVRFPPPPPFIRLGRAPATAPGRSHSRPPPRSAALSSGPRCAPPTGVLFRACEEAAMLSRTLRTATLVVAIIGWLAPAGCSTHATGVTGPPSQRTTNAPPDGWFAGPDPADASAGWQTEPGPFGGRFIPAPADGWYDFAGVPHTMLSADSLQILPKARVEHRTFFEIYGDRLWLRQEGDTVHMNSVV